VIIEVDQGRGIESYKRLKIVLSVCLPFKKCTKCTEIEKSPAQFLHSQKHAVYLSINQRFLKIHSPAQDDSVGGEAKDDSLVLTADLGFLIASNEAFWRFSA
jgi:hypothetical protein